MYFEEYEKKRGIDVLNALMFEYNNRADSINNKEARATIQFWMSESIR